MMKICERGRPSSRVSRNCSGTYRTTAIVTALKIAIASLSDA